MAGQKEDAGLAKLKMKKGWEKVTQVGQSIPMTLFMMWMTGNNVQIFSIMITVMTLYNAVVGFTSVNAGAFRKAPSPFLKKKNFFCQVSRNSKGLASILRPRKLPLHSCSSWLFASSCGSAKGWVSYPHQRPTGCRSCHPSSTWRHLCRPSSSREQLCCCCKSLKEIFDRGQQQLHIIHSRCGNTSDTSRAHAVAPRSYSQSC